MYGSAENNKYIDINNLCIYIKLSSIPLNRIKSILTTTRNPIFTYG